MEEAHLTRRESIILYLLGRLEYATVEEISRLILRSPSLVRCMLNSLERKGYATNIPLNLLQIILFLNEDISNYLNSYKPKIKKEKEMETLFKSLDEETKNKITNILQKYYRQKGRVNLWFLTEKGREVYEKIFSRSLRGESLDIEEDLYKALPGLENEYKKLRLLLERLKERK